MHIIVKMEFMPCPRAVPPPGYHSLEDALLQHSNLSMPGKPGGPSSKPGRRVRKPLEDITHLHANKSSRLQLMR